jgi:hypothetical protein
MVEKELENAAAANGLSAIVIPLLKGVLYQADDPGLWSVLLEMQSRVRDYVAVLGLDLVLDEAEGYAFLRSRPDPEDGSTPKLQRLITLLPKEPCVRLPWAAATISSLVLIAAASARLCATASLAQPNSMG